MALNFSEYKNIFTCCCLCVLSSLTLMSQELVYEIPLHVQVASSDHIIEGKVISKESYWDHNVENIYTVNVVEVYKQFKGLSVFEIVEVITPGGTVGNHIEVVTPSLTLHIGDIGIFMLRQNTVSLSSENSASQFQPTASTQGFYKYNLKNNSVYNSFISRQGITDSFYNEIQSLTNQNQIVEVAEFDVNNSIETNDLNRNNNGIIEITDLSPTILNAGVRDVLTISGSGFGNTIGTVEFRDANFGGENDMGPVYFAALESQILSWTHNEIQVEVPSRAGTGDIRVTPGIGASVVSSQILTVFYAQINPSNETNAFPTQHVDTNGNGGYTWQMHTEFDNHILARASFLRAFDSWVCTTGINWEIGEVTSVDLIAADGINIIRFDNGDELPQGVLGRTTSRFDSCDNPLSPGGSDIIVAELDIIFNDEFTGSLSAISWEFGPEFATSAEVDFETVAVHELGHAHQLAHIINPGDIMHFSTSIAQNSRVLGASDLASGNDVMNRNVNVPICNENVMTYSECSTLGITDYHIESVSVFPNPTNNRLTVSAGSSGGIESVTIYDIRGRQVKSVSFPNTNQKTIDVSELQSGVYLIKIGAKTKFLSKKLIIE